MTRFSQHDDPQPIDPDSMAERLVNFGQYKGATWAQVLERDIPYVEWLLDESNALSREEREALEELLDAERERTPTTTRAIGSAIMTSSRAKMLRTRIASQITIRRPERGKMSMTEDGRIHFTDETSLADLFWDDPQTFLTFLERLNSFAVQEGLRK